MVNKTHHDKADATPDAALAIGGGGVMKVEMVKGVEGYSIYFNDVRILGPKPWGGGTIVKRWTLSVEHAERLRDLLDEFIKSTGGTQ